MIWYRVLMIGTITSSSFLYPMTVGIKINVVGVIPIGRYGVVVAHATIA